MPTGYFSGKNITKIDMLINSQSKYATEYRYSGSNVVAIVYPRGNRVDLTYDSDDNVTERRRKTTDTDTDSDTNDIVESWTYTNDLVMSHTDPLGNVTSYVRDTAGNVTEIANW